MIETKEQYETFKAIANIGGFQGAGDLKYAMDTIEALRKVAMAADELREAMAYNKGTGETKKRLENAYGALWRANHALPDWLKDG